MASSTEEVDTIPEDEKLGADWPLIRLATVGIGSLAISWAVLSGLLVMYQAGTSDMNEVATLATSGLVTSRFTLAIFFLFATIALNRVFKAHE